ncbi:thiol reductant ABC exporter subunit CydD [Delftia tsuruhatensis]|uniref:thiol reductant ABC exporter subunit CydD n=1 Tax=Delftia tsuruhatensis TaxID=180282 RepID=UPI001F1F9020|nr:thiol reductant ABC exporter subunit CydD [Delftia tsuruhatensis]
MAGTGLLVLASLLWLPQALLLALAVQAMADGAGMEPLWPLAGGVALLGGLRAWCDASGARRASLQARTLVSALRGQVLHRLAGTSPLDRRRAASGQAASAMAEQAEAIVPWLSRYQTAQWRVRTVPLLMALAVASQSWVAALILVLAAPLIPLFMAIVGWRAKAASEKQMVELGGMNAFLLDRLRGLSTLRALDAVDATARRLRAHAESLRERSMRVLRIAFLSSAVLELFSALGVAMVAVYVGFHLLGHLPFGSWGRTLTLGQALFVLLLAPSFFDPLRELSAVWHDRAAGEAAVQALAALGRDAQPLPGALSVPGRAAGHACALRLEQVRPQAPGGTCALAPLTLDVRPGEHVALWSPSGSGKSLLLAQIAGLLPVVEPGHVTIDGQRLDSESAGRLRARMAWMGQSPHVFAGSVASNLALGRKGLAFGELRQAMRLAGLGRVAQTRSGATLGEGGAGLSGGEIVRLALARLALSRDAGLLLVDEPTAHLDPATAAQVTDALLELARGRTLIVATHDAELAAAMHRVVELLPDEGDALARELAA